jgi:hypothetical protein
MESDGADGLRFFRADGREVTAAGAAPVLSADPVDASCAQHRAAGIAINARTGFPREDRGPRCTLLVYADDATAA